MNLRQEKCILYPQISSTIHFIQYHHLLPVSRFVPVESLHSSGGLVRDHTPDCPPENLAGSSEVEGTVCGVSVHPLSEEGKVLQLVPVE